MPFVLVQGTFRILNKSPDGDSLKFKAKKKSNWNKLGGRKVRLTTKNEVQLRFEAIDALETHYRVGSAGNTLNLHQPSTLADAATDEMLKLAGFKSVQWGPTRSRVVGVAKDGLEGYILSREAERFGRPVSFVYIGKPPEADGSQVFLDAARLRQSINYKLLKAGLVYPTYYKGLFADLRAVLTAAAQDARNAKRGIWDEDKTTAGFKVTGLKSITEDNVILPKLFRRLAAYIHEVGKPLSQFTDHLANNSESVLVLPLGHFTHLDDVIEVKAGTVKMTVAPENLVFQP